MARLYRKSLKTLSSWVIDRDIFLEEATKLRNRFDEERGCSNAKAVRLLKVRKRERREREFKGFCCMNKCFDILWMYVVLMEAFVVYLEGDDISGGTWI